MVSVTKAANLPSMMRVASGDAYLIPMDDGLRGSL